MVRHWLTTKDQGWRYRLTINAFGAVLTAVITVVVVVGQVHVGRLVRRRAHPAAHRRRCCSSAASTTARPRSWRCDEDLVFDRPHREQRVVIPVNGINRSVVQAVMFGKSLASRSVAAPGRLRHHRDRGGGAAARALGAPAAGRAAGRSWSRRTGRSSGRWSPTSTSWSARGRRTGRRPPRSSSCPSTSRATGGTGCSTTSPRSASRRSLVGREHTVIADVPYRRSDHHDAAEPESTASPAASDVAPGPAGPEHRATAPGQRADQPSASGTRRGDRPGDPVVS